MVGKTLYMYISDTWCHIERYPSGQSGRVHYVCWDPVSDTVWRSRRWKT